MWVFIDVPESEISLAQKAGAELHRKSGKWFFDDAKFPASDFARWRRIPRPESVGHSAKETPSLKDDGLSLHEVAALTGHSGKVVRALIDDGRFPKPVGSSGISSRSDRWSLEQVNEWIDVNGFGSLVRGTLEDQAQRARQSVMGAQPFYSMADIAREAGVWPLAKAFQILRAAGVLQESDDEAINNRPSDEHMKKGWFGRVERYLPEKGQVIFQTIVTASGRDSVVVLLKSLHE